MRTIHNAIEECRKKLLNVYEADSTRIVRDARGAGRTTTDHVGRWFFELLQNSDDAEASKVLVHVADDAVYVADNGRGIKPEAVTAICGTDFSDKTKGTIGRKGVGFQSVYQLSFNPQLFIVNGEGIEFSYDKCREWLKEKGLNDQHVPYQWIPFPISWDQAKHLNPTLNEFYEYKTVVRLPYRSANQNQKEIEEVLSQWQPHALFAFRHVREIRSPHWEVFLTPGGDTWEMRDNRGETATQWRVARHTEYVPEKLLAHLEVDERQAITADGVSFLIAAPLEKSCVVSTEENLPVHVFYPTEQRGPVRLLLHAEFLVKSDRTALIPIERSDFNQWVADRLACHVCDFVQSAYHPVEPCSHVALLLPFEDMATHPVARALWERISQKALEQLRLADVDGNRRRTVGEAKLLSVSVDASRARRILEVTGHRRYLLHRTFDDATEARTVLKALKCQEIHDQDLMKIIAEHARSNPSDQEWLWACWEWLADWVAERPDGEEHNKRIQAAKDLPIVPVREGAHKRTDLGIVAWREAEQSQAPPKWLRLTFVDGWFRNRIQALITGSNASESPILELLNEMEIEEPGDNVIHREVDRAISRYWINKQSDPARFLRYILEQDWHETSAPKRALKRCPVPLSRAGENGEWAEAQKTYFGREWGNGLLADLYEGIEAVAFVRNNNTEQDNEKHRKVLEWLGVADSPRVVKETGATRVHGLPEGCVGWKKHLKTERDFEGRLVVRINRIDRIDHLAVDKLDRRRAIFLVRLIAKYWDRYYDDKVQIIAYGTRGKERDDREWYVQTKWWWEVRERLVMPTRGGYAGDVALTKCWLFNKRTERRIGDLLPTIDLDAFGDDKDEVHDWLANTVDLRTQLNQITVEEWKELLCKRITTLAPLDRVVSDKRLRDKVAVWYETCLDAVADRDDFPEKVFATCPILCRKSEEWDYVRDDPRYLADDDELARAFNQDVWILDIRSGLRAVAERCFGVASLSKSVRVEIEPGNPARPLDGDLQARFAETLPYVFAWRSAETKQDDEKLRARLTSFKVEIVPSLTASLTLDGKSKIIERLFAAREGDLFLQKECVNEPTLARALAEAIGVKAKSTSTRACCAAPLATNGRRAFLAREYRRPRWRDVSATIQARRSREIQRD